MSGTVRSGGAASRVLPLLLLLAGCAPDAAGDAGTFAVRDSAGVRIAESAAPAWAADDAWTVGAPVLEIGRDEGDAMQALSFVNGARRLADGRVVVANGGTSELRVFDSTGAFRRAIGRAGRGPGEFSAVRGLHRCAGDTLVVRELNELSVLDPDGRFVRTVPATILLGGGYREIEGVADDCARLLLLDRERPTPDTPPDRRLRQTLFWATAEQGVRDTIARFDGAERAPVTVQGQRLAVARPWGQAPVYAVGGDRLYLALGDAPEIRVHDATGRLREIVRWAAEPAPVTDADRALFTERRAAFIRAFPDQAAAVLPLETFDVPAHKPPYTQLLLDDGGHLWVRRYPTPSTGWPQMVDFEPAQAADWWVFDPQRRLLGTVRTPAGLRVVEVRDGLLLGIWRDADDVEHVRLHPIGRGGGP